MSLAVAPVSARTKLRFAGRSFLAFVLAPSPPIATWLADLDEVARQSFGFFANRPVILDLSALHLNQIQTAAILRALAARDIRVIAVEGVDPTWVVPALRPLAGGLESEKAVDLLAADAPGPPISSVVIDIPVRSGRSVFFPEGDLTVIGAVSSGAEVIAGGSIHVHGALRGRAIAGSTGNAKARIFCRKFEPELVAINGFYLTADECEPGLIGKPVQVRLNNDTITMSLLD